MDRVKGGRLMQEGRVLQKSLMLLGTSGPEAAYQLIKSWKTKNGGGSAQVYNYLYCLAALCNLKEEALSWLEEAIDEKGYWYRTEVFDDKDLDNIRDNKRFEASRQISERRYHSALLEADTICSWQKKSKDCLVVVIHGNQQNIGMAQMHWGFLEKFNAQVEYIQSKELDSAGLYRWEDEGIGHIQLADTLNRIGWSTYKEKWLAGYSAGCNVLLRSIVEDEVCCDKIFLQSPWMPMIDDDLDLLCVKLKEQGTEVYIIVGKDDDTCCPLVKLLVEGLKAYKVKMKVQWVLGGHNYPEDFEKRVGSMVSIDGLEVER